MNWLIAFLGPRWLGHGRATEGYFATVALVYALLLVMSDAASWDSQATRGLDVTGTIMAIPFVIAGSVCWAGLIGNLKGAAWAQPLRIAGACLNVMIAVWYIWRFFVLGLPAAYGVPYAMVQVPFSLRIVVMSFLNLPVPGAPGQAR